MTSTHAVGRRRPTYSTMVSTAALSVLSALGWLVFWSVLPAALGWHPTVVMSGSMEPRLHIGDVIVSRPVPGVDLHPGQVLLAHDPDHPGRLRLHRLVQIDRAGDFILRGDANPTNDSSPVRPAAVLGVATLRVPGIGLPLVWVSQRRILPLAGLVAVLGALVVAAGRGGSRGGRSGTSAPGGQGPSPRRRRAARVGASAAAFVAVVGVGVPAQAASRFTAEVTSTPNSFAAATYFSCTSAATSAGTDAYLAYPFLDTSGSTITDVSGNHHTGALHGSGTTRSGGAPCAADGGHALTFNGGGYVVSPKLAAPTTYSLETWFKTTTANGVLMGFGSSESIGVPVLSEYDRSLYLTSAGRLSFGTYTPGAALDGGYNVLTTPTVVTDGSWHHVVATYAGGRMALYLDGSLVAAMTTAGAESYTGYWHLAGNAISGWPGAPSSAYYIGSLGFTAVYGTALNAAAVAAHDAAGRP